MFAVNMVETGADCGQIITVEVGEVQAQEDGAVRQIELEVAEIRIFFFEDTIKSDRCRLQFFPVTRGKALNNILFAGGQTDNSRPIMGKGLLLEVFSQKESALFLGQDILAKVLMAVADAESQVCAGKEADYQKNGKDSLGANIHKFQRAVLENQLSRLIIII